MVINAEHFIQKMIDVSKHEKRKWDIYPDVANDVPDVLPFTPTIVSVYLDNGIVYEYVVEDPMKGREHADAIIRMGYRHTKEGTDDLEWFPPHRISKVKVTGAGESNYKDIVRAT